MYTDARTVFEGEKSESQKYSLRKVFLFFNKVMRSSKFDPCFTSSEEVGEQLKSLVVWEGCKLDGLLNKGEINQAAQLALSVLKTAKAKSVCGQGLSLITITQVSTFRFTKQFHFKGGLLVKTLFNSDSTIVIQWLPFFRDREFALSSCTLTMKA